MQLAVRPEAVSYEPSDDRAPLIQHRRRQLIVWCHGKDVMARVTRPAFWFPDVLLTVGRSEGSHDYSGDHEAMVIAPVGLDDASTVSGHAEPPGSLSVPGHLTYVLFGAHATTLRVLAMVAPTALSGNYVAAVVGVVALAN